MNMRHNPRTFAKPAQKPKGVLTVNEWHEMRDALVLALDALGDGPQDVCKDFLVNCILNQRVAIKISHAKLEKLQ